MREASSSHRVHENAYTTVVRDLSEDLLMGGADNIKIDLIEMGFQCVWIHLT
jgi:hypothetical protein